MADETRDFTVAEFTEGLRERLENKPPLNTTIKFLFDEGGIVYIDGKSSPASVSNDDQPSIVTLKMSLVTLNKLHRKETNGMTAYMMGKIKVEGDMLAAMKLDQLLA
jgi:putative sterol carrier protein